MSRKFYKSFGAVISLALVILVSAACGAGSSGLQGAGGTAEQPGQSSGPLMPQLPAVAGLPHSAPRSGSYVEADLQRKGVEYDQTMPSSKTQTKDPQTWVHLEAPQPAEANGLSDAAYAVFHFQAPGYDRDGLLAVDALFTDENGEKLPQDYKKVWIGLSNWSSGRWDWFPLQSNLVTSNIMGQRNFVQTGGLTPYLSDSGDLYAAVISFCENCYIGRVHLGTSPPYANLSLSNSGNALLQGKLDASKSFSEYGELVKYEFDPENDGSFVDNGTSSVYEFVYPAVGDYTAAVRVTDNLGMTATKTAAASITDHWQQNFKMAGYLERISAVLPMDDNTVMAFGHLASNKGADADYPLVCLKLQHDQAADSRGGVVGAYGYVEITPTQFVAVNCVARFGQDMILVGGKVRYVDDQGSPFYEGLLQAWNSDGAVLWDRRFSGLTSIEALACSENSIFALGSGDTVSATNVLLKLDELGNLQACQKRNYPGGQYADPRDIVVQRGLGGLTLGVAALHSGSGRTWITQWGTNLEFESGLETSDPTFDHGERLLYSNGFIGPSYFYIAGTSSENLPVGFVQKLDLDTNMATTRSFYSQAGPNQVDKITGLAYVGGDYALAATIGDTSQGTQRCMLLDFDSGMNKIGGVTLNPDLSAYASSQGGNLVSFRSGMLVCGQSYYPTGEAANWQNAELTWYQMPDVQWTVQDGAGDVFDPQSHVASGQVKDVLSKLVANPAIGSGLSTGILAYLPKPPAIFEH